MIQRELLEKDRELDALRAELSATHQEAADQTQQLHQLLDERKLWEYERKVCASLDMVGLGSCGNVTWTSQCGSHVAMIELTEAARGSS